MSLSVGTSLGRYEIRRLLGAGGMGEVYLAEDLQLRRKVALKLLSTAFTGNKDRLYRFEREAFATSTLNHPNILTVYEIGREGDHHFIATEFIEGESLRGYMERTRLELREILDIAIQVTSALASAHTAGVVHRDVKPENIMVRHDGIVKVVDFGLAKLTERETVPVDMNAPTKPLHKTAAGIVIGTVSYVSPEQARAIEVDGRSDVWSLGVVLYEMLAGCLPFMAGTVSDTLSAILRDEPSLLTVYSSEVTPELQRIVTKSLRKNREERYQTVMDLGVDLKNFLQALEFHAQFKRLATFQETCTKNDAKPSVLKPAATPNRKDVGAEELLTPSTITSTGDEIAPSQAVPPNNLSFQQAKLIGRETEVARIAQLLRSTDVRLVTLTGVGGTGKTRLAEQVAHEILHEFLDGVFFIDLAPVEDAELVISAIAQPLGVQESGRTTLTQAVKEFLKDKQILLVLDNFEQVAPAAMFVKELLSTSLSLKALVTSRVPLHLTDEHQFDVPPLEIPTTHRTSSVNELIRYPAILLFMRRAEAVKPDFAVTDENAHTVAEICMKLDGLPLAIELAATRIKLLSVQTLLERLGNQLKLLTGGARDRPARQKTMRSTISWSYDLLGEDEKILLNRLSVFVGGCPLEAAEQVCKGFRGRQLEVLDGITSLVDSGLLLQKPMEGGESRLRMLEVILEYAQERLEENGDAESMKDRHARFYLAMGTKAEPELIGAGAAEWLDKLEEEHNNLRAALRWLVDNDAEAALRLCWAISQFWMRRCYFTEGREWIERALLKDTNASAEIRAKGLIGAGELTQNDPVTASRFHELALRVSQESGDARLIARSSKNLGRAAYMKGDLTTAQEMLERALAEFRLLGDIRGIGYTLLPLGEVARQQGQLATARMFYEESLALFKETGDQTGITANLINIGAVACLNRDFDASNACFSEALRISQKLGDRAAVSISLDGCGALMVERGDMGRAVRLFGAAQTSREEIGIELEPTDRAFRERYVSYARVALGAEAFSAADDLGRTLTTNEAIAIALEESAKT
jgi:predicted ATPase/serine/threonine protein kinase